MIRFRCPACNKTLKVPESLTGKKVTCPRCNEPALTPATPSEPQVGSPDETPGFFSTMSHQLRLIVALVAITGGLGLLTAVLLSLLGKEAWITHGAMVLAGCSFLALLTILYGHGTGCPCCGKWWSRTKVKSEVADREVFDRGGTKFGKSMTRTEFQCTDCRHMWSVTESEEYRVPERSEKQRSRK